MTTYQLNQAANRWQRVLGMSEWEIVVKLAPGREMVQDGEPLEGSAWWIPESSPPSAEIKIRARSERQEETLVHELLHVRLEGHKAVRKYDPMYERGLNAIASALMVRHEG